MQRQLEVAHLFHAYGQAYRDAHGNKLHKRHHRAMRAIEICRTATLGGHVDECDECGNLRISYNSCRNRHCPKCQCLDKERWLEDRKKDLLPVQYYHVVFTIPEVLRPLALRNQKVFYGMLFRAVSETLKELCRDPKYLGAEIGFFAILHTWSQTLVHHPHIHCIVTGGGLSQDGKRWINGKRDFFIPYKVLSRLFRGKLIDYLQKGYDTRKLVFPGKVEYLKNKNSFKLLINDLYDTEWVVYCKESLKRPEHVIEYLGRYTHRVAISNDRIVKLEDGRVTFRYRDSQDNNSIKFMPVDVFEFIRRYLLHILPDNFMKIRHYGILSNRNKEKKLSICQQLLGVKKPVAVNKESWKELLLRLKGVDLNVCPKCGKGRMVLRETLAPEKGRSPP